ncbi:HTH-type transcriptional regulator BetI [Emticicia aquatica]|jgi:AcrR family transcriptional regulator|uniref:HTH-type transcriptional regulator BetI n=1 Tax=Emticicia aquatica TaxID=1681835 RepID=A0ABM9ALA8_9BACT|nr:TetR/AcrR family transcriptional regulator [Emticicia aquatica]CAH0994558.1 HTH-type transcriptional regulator BetI [Emticicia aquatica]
MNKEQKILETALKLFVEFGFHGTPTSKIAKEAGVANGTLFHYFATKETLIKELYVSIKNELNQLLMAKLDVNDEIKIAAKKLYSNTILWALANKDKFHYIQQVQFSPHLAQIPSDVSLEQTKMHTEFIELGKAKGAIKLMPTDFIFTLVNSQITGIYQYILTQPPTQQHEIIEQGFEMIWDLIALKK